MKLAIFDIDGTIFRSSLVIELVRALVYHRIFPKQADNEIQKVYLAWLDRKGNYTDYINKVVKIYIKYIAGKSSVHVLEIARLVISAQKNRVYRYTRDLIKQLKKQKYFLIAISGSPSYIVADYARAIGFNKFFGTEMEIVSGKFTGKVLNLDAAFKKKKVLMDFVRTLSVPPLAAKGGTSPPSNFAIHRRQGYGGQEASSDLRKGDKGLVVDWKQSIAVGDTESDVEMLSLVGRPIAFNPNHQLAKIAKHRKWKIIVERKDVVYEVKDFSFLSSRQNER